MSDITQITVRLFGSQARDARASEIRLSFDHIPTCAQVIAALGDTCAEIKPSLGISRLALNQSFATPGTIVTGSDEVALIGLVGGG
jgi:molybdopterin converting factor small subunit